MLACCLYLASQEREREIEQESNQLAIFNTHMYVLLLLYHN